MVIVMRLKTQRGVLETQGALGRAGGAAREVICKALIRDAADAGSGACSGCGAGAGSLCSPARGCQCAGDLRWH